VIHGALRDLPRGEALWALWARVRLRVHRSGSPGSVHRPIGAVDDVPKSDKLLRLIVDFGDHKRAILAGMKTERASPQELVGLQTLFVVNLEPKWMAGEVSQGMLFDIGFADGITPALAMLERAVPNGARAG
jgi:tRNA-binding protein